MSAMVLPPDVPECCLKATDQWRWACPTCGRFIAERSIRSWDEVDPGAYYGVRGCTQAVCGSCGPIEPDFRPTRLHDCVAS